LLALSAVTATGPSQHCTASNNSIQCVAATFLFNSLCITGCSRAVLQHFLLTNQQDIVRHAACLYAGGTELPMAATIAGLRYLSSG